MNDESLDDFLFNIESDKKEKIESKPVESSAEDSKFEENIAIDLDDDGIEIIAADDMDQPAPREEITEKKMSGGGINDATPQGIDASRYSDQKKKYGITAGDTSIGASAIPSVKFTARGTRTWNIREPYIINIIGDKLKENHDDLAESIYFVDSQENESSIQGKIKIALLRNISGDMKELPSKYKEFIYRHIIKITEELVSKYGIKGERQKLFIYHTGVYTIYRMLTGNLQTLKIGYCYKRLPDNRVTKFFPLEYIKVSVLNWFEDNINIFNLPFDGIHEFNELKRLVTGNYYCELEKYNKKMDETILKLKLTADKKFNREEYLRNKLDEWFGPVNIIIYNRFIERTIFKYSDRHVHR